MHDLERIRCGLARKWFRCAIAVPGGFGNTEVGDDGGGGLAEVASAGVEDRRCFEGSVQGTRFVSEFSFMTS